MIRAIERNLAIINFVHGDYANASIINHHVFTALHVARGQKNTYQPSTNLEHVYFAYAPVGFDLAISCLEIFSKGFFGFINPTLNQKVMVVGYRGKNKTLFSIPSRVVQINDNHTIVVVPQNVKDRFQIGMSGSVAVIDNYVVGVLSERDEVIKNACVFTSPSKRM